MAVYVARRLGAMVPVLLVVGVVVFVLIRLTPGDPATTLAGPQATAEQIAALRTALDLDAPPVLQFVRWFGGALTGNLGHSIYFDEPVARTLVHHAGATLSLTAVAFALAIGVAIPAGIWAAARPRTPIGRAFVPVSLLGISIPSFWLALVAILIFAVRLRWFPVAGYVQPSAGWWPWLRALILPAAVLATAQAGMIARIVRDGMLAELAAPYIRTARAKGQPERRVILRHALPNALIPTSTAIGTSVGSLLGGAVVTETVFAIPGIGQLVVDSIARRDYPVVQGVVLFVAALYVAVNAIVDLSYALVDPRIRYE